MAAFHSHAMVTVNDQGCFIIHFFDYPLNELFSIEEFALNFWVLASMSVPSCIHSQHVQKQHIKVATIFHFISHIRNQIVIDFVDVA